VRGVEGKIKAGVTPYGVTPCLHIIFGSTPRKGGVTPFGARRAEFIGLSGGDPWADNPAIIGMSAP